MSEAGSSLELFRFYSSHTFCKGVTSRFRFSYTTNTPAINSPMTRLVTTTSVSCGYIRVFTFTKHTSCGVLTKYSVKPVRESISFQLQLRMVANYWMQHHMNVLTIVRIWATGSHTQSFSNSKNIAVFKLNRLCVTYTICISYNILNIMYNVCAVCTTITCYDYTC